MEEKKMITKMFEGNGMGKGSCWYCLASVVLLATNMAQ